MIKFHDGLSQRFLPQRYCWTICPKVPSSAYASTLLASRLEAFQTFLFPTSQLLQTSFAPPMNDRRSVERKSFSLSHYKTTTNNKTATITLPLAHVSSSLSLLAMAVSTLVQRPNALPLFSSPPLAPVTTEAKERLIGFIWWLGGAWI